MAADYTGIVALAQTSLAINMAYIALDRFRYRAKILQRVEEAQSRTAEMPGHFEGDLAWQNVKGIVTGDSPKPWTVGRAGFWFYYCLFRKGWDVPASYALAGASVVVLITLAGLGVVRSAVPPIATQFVDLTVFAIPLMGVMVPVMLWIAGRYTVRCAEKSIEDNMAHLARRMRDEATEDIDAKLQNMDESQ